MSAFDRINTLNPDVLVSPHTGWKQTTPAGNSDMAGTSTYDAEIAMAICERIASGESVRRICMDENMPAQSTVYKWLVENETFSEKYARAREVQAEFLAEEIIHIADDSSGDRVADEDGNERMDAEFVARSRLRVDARKWYASKVAPKKYGDKVTHEQNITITDLTDAELDARLKELTNAQPQPGAED